MKTKLLKVGEAVRFHSYLSGWTFARVSHVLHVNVIPECEVIDKTGQRYVMPQWRAERCGEEGLPTLSECLAKEIPS
jgi:hypothetical protein